MAKTIKKKTAKGSLSPQEEIQSITHTITDTYDAYRQPANVVLTLVAIVLAVGVIWSIVRSNNEKQAGQLLSAAYDAYSPGGGAPANYPLALQRFQDVVKQYGGTVSGAIAQFSVGNVYARMGQPESALKEYDAFVKKHGGEKFLLGLVYQRMGYAYLALGRKDDAVKAFGQAETLAGTGPATYELARIADASGDIVDAQKRYKEISEKLPSTGWAAEARVKVSPPDLKATGKAAEGAKAK